MTKTDTVYRYHSLNESNREFRVLRLLLALDSGSEESERIEAELQTVSLNGEHEYTALSYCWGERPAIHDMYVHGHRFAIRPNLFDFLKVLKKERYTGLIFIDAICINQDDLGERSSQVRLMGDLYRSAVDVIAWLGSVQVDEQSRVCVRPETYTTIDQLREPIRKQEKDPFKACNPLLILFMCSSEYWERLWVVQEATLARKLTLWRGSIAIDAELLLENLTLLIDGANDKAGTSKDLLLVEMACASMRSSQALDSRWRWVAAYNVLLLRQTSGLSCGKKLSLVQAISQFSHHVCKDPHDKVYAILGMTIGNVPVDYNMPLSELYVRTVTEAMLEYSQLTATGGATDRQMMLHNLTAKYFLASAFGWSLLHPTVCLLVGHDLWLDIKGHFYLGFTSTIPFRAGGKDPKARVRKAVVKMVRAPTIAACYVAIKARIKICEIRNAAMHMPGDVGDAHTYLEWLELILGWMRETRASGSSPEYMSRLQQAFPDGLTRSQ